MLRTRLGQARRYLKLAGDSLWRKHPVPARRHSDAELLARVEELNAAAERQWQQMNADPERRGYLLEKPFAGLRETPAMLYRLGLALEALDLGLGHTVLDFGAGSCWLSIILNRLRCRTISVDVSPTALAIGREALALEPHAHPELDPQFLPYDGRKIPLPDASVDRVLCFDSFHHVPNQDEILAELFRVLRPGGRVVMAEPGEGHAHADASEFDAANFGVLENDLVLEDLLERVRRAGFGEVFVKPYPDVPILVLSGAAHLRLLAGDHSLFPMNHMIDSLKQFHLLILLKGQPTRDSRNPSILRAKITVPDGTRLAGRAGTLAGFTMQVENTGDTTWLAAENRVTGGYVGVGGHLLDASGQTIRIGFLTERLPRDVAPGERVEVPQLVRSSGAGGPLPAAAGPRGRRDRLVLPEGLADDRRRDGRGVVRQPRSSPLRGADRAARQLPSVRGRGVVPAAAAADERRRHDLARGAARDAGDGQRRRAARGRDGRRHRQGLPADPAAEGRDAGRDGRDRRGRASARGPRRPVRRRPGRRADLLVRVARLAAARLHARVADRARIERIPSEELPRRRTSSQARWPIFGQGAHSVHSAQPISKATLRSMKGRVSGRRPHDARGILRLSQ